MRYQPENVATWRAFLRLVALMIYSFGDVPRNYVSFNSFEVRLATGRWRIMVWRAARIQPAESLHLTKESSVCHWSHQNLLGRGRTEVSAKTAVMRRPPNRLALAARLLLQRQLEPRRGME